jgi:hypothetical protein
MRESKLYDGLGEDYKSLVSEWSAVSDAIVEVEIDLKRLNPHQDLAYQ